MKKHIYGVVDGHHNITFVEKLTIFTTVKEFSKSVKS